MNKKEVPNFSELLGKNYLLRRTIANPMASAPIKAAIVAGSGMVVNPTWSAYLSSSCAHLNIALASPIFAAAKSVFASEVSKFESSSA